MSQSKTSVFLSLLFVFLSGTVLGSLGYRWYSINSVQAGPPGPRQPRDPAEVKKHIIAEMTDEVKLDRQQVEQVNKIFDDTRAKFDVLHGEMSEQGKKIWQGQTDQINAILRPDQRPLYQALHEKHDRERKKKRGEHGIQPDTKK